MNEEIPIKVMAFQELFVSSQRRTTYRRQHGQDKILRRTIPYYIGSAGTGADAHSITEWQQYPAADRTAADRGRYHRTHQEHQTRKQILKV